jgi:hypothetical protein
MQVPKHSAVHSELAAAQLELQEVVFLYCVQGEYEIDPTNSSSFPHNSDNSIKNMIYLLL